MLNRFKYLCMSVVMIGSTTIKSAVLSLILLTTIRLDATVIKGGIKLVKQFSSILPLRGQQTGMPTALGLSCQFSSSPLARAQQAYHDSSDKNQQQQEFTSYDKFLLAGSAVVALSAKVVYDTYANTNECPFGRSVYAAEHPEWAQGFMRKIANSNNELCRYCWASDQWPNWETIADNIVPIAISSEWRCPTPDSGWRTFPLSTFLTENEKLRSKVIQAIADNFEAIMTKDDEGHACGKLAYIIFNYQNDAKSLVMPAVVNIGSLLKEKGAVEIRSIRGLNGKYIYKNYNIAQRWGAEFLRRIIRLHPNEAAQLIHLMPKVVQEHPMITCRGDETAGLMSDIFEIYPEVRQPLLNAVLNAFSSVAAFSWKRDLLWGNGFREFDYAGYFDLLQHVFSKYPELRPSITEFITTNLISKKERMNAGEEIQDFVLTILRGYPDQRESIVNAIGKNESMLLKTTYGKKIVYLSKRLEDPMPNQTKSYCLK